ncbi:MAG TPA: hypothetical protein VGQ62_23410 [Chloroflexota bacterium]|nr:hypothetical protein [Chloroflexota bacterium]
MNTAPHHGLAIVGRSSAGQPRTLRVKATHASSSGAAYRRLTLTILRLDVATLAGQLRMQRLGRRITASQAA